MFNAFHCTALTHLLKPEEGGGGDDEEEEEEEVEEEVEEEDLEEFAVEDSLKFRRESVRDLSNRATRAGNAGEMEPWLVRLRSHPSTKGEEEESWMHTPIKEDDDIESRAMAAVRDPMLVWRPRVSMRFPLRGRSNNHSHHTHSTAL